MAQAGERVLLVPPGIGCPVHGRSIATRRSAAEPEFRMAVAPDPDRMAVEFARAMQTPVPVVQVRPIAVDAVFPEQSKFLRIGDFYVLVHVYLLDGGFSIGDLPTQAQSELCFQADAL